MKRLFLMFFVALFSVAVITSCGGESGEDPAPAPPTQDDNNSSGDDNNDGNDNSGDDNSGSDDNTRDFSSLENYIQSNMNSEKINGLSAFIIKDNKVLWEKGFGKADVANNKDVTPETGFMLGSVSKAVTGVVLMTLYDQGKFKLDDDINNYLPFKVINPKHPDTPITFKMVLAHASSIYYDAYNDLDETLIYTYGGDTNTQLGDFLKDYLTEGGKYYDAAGVYLNDKPGTAFKYSNIGSALCGYLAEVIAGEAFSEYSKKVLFEPLKMTNTGWLLKDVDVNNVAIPYKEDGTPIGHYTFIDYPNGQLRSNAKDMSRFMLMMMNNGTYDGAKILESATVELMLKDAGFDSESKFGLSWYYEEDGNKNSIVGHNGAEQGVQTEFFYNPATKVGIMVTANKEVSLEDIRNELLSEGGK